MSFCHENWAQIVLTKKGNETRGLKNSMSLKLMNGIPSKVWGLDKNRKINKKGDVYLAPESTSWILRKCLLFLKYHKKYICKILIDMHGINYA